MLFPFGIDSYESIITATVDVPEDLRNAAKAGDVNIFYKNDVVTAEEYWPCVHEWSYLPEGGRNSCSGPQPHCNQYLSDYKKIVFVCPCHIGPCSFQ